MTSTDKLEYLLQTKNLIKDAIIAKGVNVSDEDTFRQYAGLIHMIRTIEEKPDGPSDTFKVTVSAAKHIFNQNARSTAELSDFRVDVNVHEHVFDQNAISTAELSDFTVDTTACVIEEE